MSKRRAPKRHAAKHDSNLPYRSQVPRTVHRQVATWVDDDPEAPRDDVPEPEPEPIPKPLILRPRSNHQWDQKERNICWCASAGCSVVPDDDDGLCAVCREYLRVLITERLTD